MAQLTRIGLTRRELATVLAALRMYQRTAFGIHAGTLDSSLPEHEVATDGGAIKPMTDDAIDDLCLRMNNATRDLPIVDPRAAADLELLTSAQDADLIRASRRYGHAFQIHPAPAKGGAR